jgi:hypothetical protein
MSLLVSRPSTAGLATGVAIIVAWSLVIVPPPGGAAQTLRRIGQLESQAVQLDTLIRWSAPTLDNAANVAAPAKGADASGDRSGAGGAATQLTAAASLMPVTGRGAAPLTPTAAPSQLTATAALIPSSNPITVVVQQFNAFVTGIQQAVSSALDNFFLQLQILLVVLAFAIIDGGGTLPLASVAPAAALSHAAGVTTVPGRPGRTVNVEKTPTSVALSPQTGTPKPTRPPNPRLSTGVGGLAMAKLHRPGAGSAPAGVLPAAVSKKMPH